MIEKDRRNNLQLIEVKWRVIYSWSGMILYFLEFYFESGVLFPFEIPSDRNRSYILFV